MYIYIYGCPSRRIVRPTGNRHRCILLRIPFTVVYCLLTSSCTTFYFYGEKIISYGKSPESNKKIMKKIPDLPFGLFFRVYRLVSYDTYVRIWTVLK